MPDALPQDIRHGFRLTLRSPGFSVVVVSTLALVLAANASLFSVINATLLQPLPFDDPERLVFLRHQYADMEGSGTPPLLVDYRREVSSFESVSASYPWNTSLTGAGDAERLRGLFVSADFFETFGVEAWRGRTFVTQEEQPGQDKVVVLGHGLWQRRFGADEALVGRTIRLDGEAYEVVGIMPPGFTWGRGWGREAVGEVWAPYALTPARIADDQRGSEYLDVYGRLRAGATVEQARAELDALRIELRERFPDRYSEASGWRVIPDSVQARRVDGLRPALLALLAAVGLLLLIAGSNIAGLLLARLAGRQKEIALRAALGASGWRIARTLLAEGAVLSGVAAAIGLAVAWFLVAWLDRIDHVALPRSAPIQVDSTVVVFTLAATVVAIIVGATAPAWHGSRADLMTTLRGMRGTGTTRSASRTRRGLVVVQTALALTLLVGAGLLVRSLTALGDVAPGYRTSGVLAARVSLPSSRYTEGPARLQFVETTFARLAGRAGVSAVAATSSLPLSGVHNSGTFHIEGRIIPPGQPLPHAESWRATPGYFRVLGIPLTRGRTFDDRDTADSTDVVVINETLARRYFAGEDPVGARIDFRGGPDEHQWSEIVGVVGDVRDRSLDTVAEPQLYAPYAQRPSNGLFLVARVEDDPLAALPALRAAVRAGDPDLPIFDVSTMEALVAGDTGDRRVAVQALGAFAGAAVFLATLGLYGLLAQTVRERRGEIGLRMALGASAPGVVRLFLREGAPLVGAGVVVGIALAYAASGAIESLVYGVTTADSATYVGVALLLGIIGLGACAIPAWRATQLDPAQALRTE